MTKQKINRRKNTALESHKKSDKAKWAITFISLILIATLLGGLSFYIVNNNKISNPPAVEQGKVKYSDVFDMKKGYGEMSENLSLDTCDSIFDKSFEHDIVIDFYQLDGYQVVCKSLGSLFINDVILRATVTNSYFCSYIFFDCEMIKNLLNLDNNLSFTAANLTCDVNYRDGNYDRTGFGSMEVSTELYRRQGEMVLSYFGLEFTEKDPVYKYFDYDKLHFTVYLQLLGA